MDRNMLTEESEFHSWCKRMGYSLSSSEGESLGRIYNKDTKKYWDHLFKHIKPVVLSQNLQKTVLVQFLRSSSMPKPLKLNLSRKQDLDLLLKHKELETENKYLRISLDENKKNLKEKKNDLASTGQLISALQPELDANLDHSFKLESLIRSSKKLLRCLKKINGFIQQILSEKPSNSTMNSYLRGDPDVVVSQNDLEEDDDVLRALSADVLPPPSEVFTMLKEKQAGYLNKLKEEIEKLDRIDPKFPSPESCNSLLTKITEKEREILGLSETVQSLKEELSMLVSDNRGLIQRSMQDNGCSVDEAERKYSLWLKEESLRISMLAKEETISKIRTAELEHYDQTKLFQLASLQGSLEENLESLAENLQRPLVDLENYYSCAKQIQCELKSLHNELLDSGGLFYSSLTADVVFPNVSIHNCSSVTSSIYKELFSELLMKLGIDIDDKKLSETILNKVKKIESLEAFVRGTSANNPEVCFDSSFVGEPLYDCRSMMLELKKKTNHLAELLDFSEKIFRQWGPLGVFRCLEVMDSVHINGIPLPVLLKEVKKNISDIEALKKQEETQICQLNCG